MGNNQSTDVPVYYKAGIGVSLYKPMENNQDPKLRNRNSSLRGSKGEHILKGNLKNKNGVVGAGTEGGFLSEEEMNRRNGTTEGINRNHAPDLSQLRIEIDESGFVEDENGEPNADRLSNSLKGNFSPTSLCEKNMRFCTESGEGFDGAKIYSSDQYDNLQQRHGARNTFLTSPSDDENSLSSHLPVSMSDKQRSHSTKSDFSDIKNEIADQAATDEEYEQLSPLPFDRSSRTSPKRLCPKKLKLKLNEIAAQNSAQSKSYNSSSCTSPESQSFSNKREGSTCGDPENSISGISSPELELLNPEIGEAPVVYASTFNNLEDEIHGVEDEFENLRKEIQALSSKYSMEGDPASDIFQEIFQRYPSIRVRQTERGFHFNPVEQELPHHHSRQNSETGDGSIDLSWDLENVLDMVYSEGSENLGPLGSRESTPGSVQGRSLNISALDASVNCTVELDGSLYEDELHLHLGKWRIGNKAGFVLPA